MKKIAVLLIGFVISVGQLRADEGMWPLIMIQQLQDSMQARGLKLTADDIYNINKACTKDAVLRLMTKQNRMFCTGEIISNQGLFLTNHHCGYGSIQELSTNEDNILANGFWAKNKSEERKANFNIGLLAKVEDVTSLMLDSISLTMDEAARAKAVTDKLTKLQASLKEGLGADKDNYIVEVVPFYAGNKYLAMYYMVYKDIRLVGTPPENIGKFGGETDNWMWPRHTADFSMFRIYANADNKPADYNASNKPYSPLHFFPINIQGKNPEDFAMIMGYPGRTQRYTYSKGIQYFASKERPMRVKVRRDVLDVYEEFMHADPKIKLMYADKFAGLSNYWKKFMGEASALPQQHLFEKRKAEEEKLKAWINANNKGATYNQMFDLYNQAYSQQEKYGLYSVYFQDGVSNSQPMVFALGLSKLESLLKDKSKSEEAKKAATEMMKELDEQYKEYFDPIEVKVLATVLMHLTEDLDHANLPKELVDLSVKYKKDYSKMAADLYAKSFLTSKDKMKAFLSSPSAKKMNKDMIYVIASAYMNKMNVDMRPISMEINSKLSRANRLFQAAMLEMDGKKLYSPDANGTMRLTYGRVLPYNAKDAVSYKEFTTSKGILEKYTPGDIEFDAPKKLVDMLKAKDFGQYADKDGELHACFLTDNDITGGNSGSPVINGRGELIGTAFDGNWEAIASDFGFDANLQRTISLDIRYTLFIMDKFGGAGYLLNEMKIVKEGDNTSSVKSSEKVIKSIKVPENVIIPSNYKVNSEKNYRIDFNKDGTKDFVGYVESQNGNDGPVKGLLISISPNSNYFLPVDPLCPGGEINDDCSGDVEVNEKNDIIWNSGGLFGSEKEIFKFDFTSNNFYLFSSSYNFNTRSYDWSESHEISFANGYYNCNYKADKKKWSKRIKGPVFLNDISSIMNMLSHE